MTVIFIFREDKRLVIHEKAMTPYKLKQTEFLRSSQHCSKRNVEILTKVLTPVKSSIRVIVA